MPSRPKKNSTRSRTGESVPVVAPPPSATTPPNPPRPFAGGSSSMAESTRATQAFFPMSPHFSKGAVIRTVGADSPPRVQPAQEKRRSGATWCDSLFGPMITPTAASEQPVAGPSGEQARQFTGKESPAQYEPYKRTHTKRHYAEKNATSAWSECAKVVKDHHEGVLKRWKDEIDTLLVYAGLFSAVLTAFTVETYVLLQPSPTDTMNELLAQMSAQLNGFSGTPTSINSTQPSTRGDQAAFSASLTAVWINTLWFSSLICSLSAASIGMMVKQWLHENELGLFGTSRDIARLRQYRYEALTKWHVGTIVAFLPILLQLASALFLAGLLVLLWSLHQVVAGVASGLVGALLVFTIATVLAPSFSPSCAYRSPQALACVFIVQTIRRALWTLSQAVAFVLRRQWGSRAAQLVSGVGVRVVHLRWAGIERPIVQKHQHDLDQQALLAASALVLDDSDAFNDKVLRPCMRTLPSRYGHRCLRAMCGNAAPLPGLEDRDLSASSGKAVSLALEVIGSHLDSIEDNNGLSREPIENLVADLRWRLEFPYIDVKVSVQLYGTLARLLETCTKDSRYTADVFRILDNLSHRRWLSPAHYHSISCGKAAPAVTSALEGLLSRAASVDALFDSHHRLIKFLAVCHLRPGFCHNDDTTFVQKRLLGRLQELGDFFNTLAEGRYRGWFASFDRHLHSLLDPKFINFVIELYQHLPEAEGMIRYLIMYLDSDEVLSRVSLGGKLGVKSRGVVQQLLGIIQSPPSQPMQLASTVTEKRLFEVPVAVPGGSAAVPRGSVAVLRGSVAVPDPIASRPLD